MDNITMAVILMVSMSTHNPGNIERSKYQWIGQSEHQRGRMVSFMKDIYGYRAMAITLLSYQDVHGIGTVPKIIERYAPGIENPTTDYIYFVLDQTKFHMTQKLDLHDKGTLLKLMKAMTQFEKGSQFVIRESDIKKGIDMAMETKHVQLTK